MVRNGGFNVPVSNFFIRRILDRIRLLNQYDEDDIDMMRYSLQAILWEIEKLIIIFVLFSLIGRHDYFLITLMALISIRVIAGGYHSKTAIKCLLVTLFGFFLAIVVLPLINLNTLQITILTGFCLWVTFLAAPMRTIEKEAIQNKDKDGQKRIYVLIITSIWLAFVFTFKTHAYAYPVLWVIVLQNAQLLFEYLRRKKLNHPLES